MDLRRNPKKIPEAIERNETVTLSNRGKPVARIEPIKPQQRPDITKDPAFGMWADREDMSDPCAYVREIRKGRFDAL